MLPREKFIMALEGKQPPGRVPHFELLFFLTMEVFGRVHPNHRSFVQWEQMSRNEQKLHTHDIADLYVKIAQEYEHSAIFFQSMWSAGKRHDERMMDTLAEIREISGMHYCLLAHGDAIYGILTGNNMMEFISDIADRPQKLKDEAKRKVERAINTAELYKKDGVLDGFVLGEDYCFNQGPFLSPVMFDEFVTPYLCELIAGYRQMGFYAIKHTDGNIMPILDSLVSARPHAIHSLDPQGGVDIAQVKRLVGQEICLIGNVNCSLMSLGSDEKIIESARYALKHGMPGGGYIFSTSNCIHAGMAPRQYELVLDVWKKEGNYTSHEFTTREITEVRTVL